MYRLNPKVDFAFKKLFGSEENKDLLMSFINSVLSEEQQIVNIELKNPYNLANYKDGKMSILDIKAIDEKGIWYDIEMQVTEQSFYDKRAFYYWAKVYSDQMEGGYNYDKLKKTIRINILDFNYLEEEEYHNVYKVYNEKSKNELSNIFEMHFIELNKFNKDFNEVRTALDRWVTFLNRAYELDKDKMPKELEKDITVKKALEKLQVMYLNKEEREFYENDLKAMMVRKEELRTAIEKGLREGREVGRAEGREEQREQSRLKDAEMVLKLLTKKFKNLDKTLKKKIEDLGSDNLNLIIEEILDIESLEDVEKYL